VLIGNIPSSVGRKEYGEKKLIVIHAMGEFIDTEERDYHAPDFVTKIGLSVHKYITPSGVILKQRDDHSVAYHARDFNSGSLGVELLVPGLHTYETFLNKIKTVDWMSNIQFRSLVEVISDWTNEFRGIKEIKGHDQLSPGRKFDPGPYFDYELLFKETKFFSQS